MIVIHSIIMNNKWQPKTPLIINQLTN